MKRTEKAVNMFNEIAMPHRTMEKQTKMMEILKDFNPQYIDGTGIIIDNSNDEGVTKVIVSHFDLVGPFERGFKEGDTIMVYEDESIYGALDNTITNAVLMNEILENGVPENTIILFTDGEESGMWGMRTFMRDNVEKIGNMFFINLDVTNDNWEHMTSVEYDYPRKSISEEIDANIQAGFTTARFADDMNPVIDAGGDGFSYCLPTREYCHTYDSNTTIDHLVAYEKGLTYLVQELNIQDKEPDGSTYLLGQVA